MKHYSGMVSQTDETRRARREWEEWDHYILLSFIGRSKHQVTSWSLDLRVHFNTTLYPISHWHHYSCTFYHYSCTFYHYSCTFYHDSCTFHHCSCTSQKRQSEPNISDKSTWALTIWTSQEFPIEICSVYNHNVRLNLIRMHQSCALSLNSAIDHKFPQRLNEPLTSDIEN